MKKLILLLLIVLFIFIFIKSETLEIREVLKTNKAGKFQTAESHSRKYIFHWDRFVRYLKDIPEKLF